MPTVTFTSSTTWMAPERVYSVTLARAQGSGGSGGNNGATGGAGGGGGGGGYATTANIPVVPNRTYAVVVGGSQTYFVDASTCMGEGGQNGESVSGTGESGAGGAGGGFVGDSGTGGTAGGGGDDGEQRGGNGGDSANGSGGGGAGPGVSVNGDNGGDYGGGGGGAGWFGGGAGGTGGGGFVEITYTAEPFCADGAGAVRAAGSEPLAAGDGCRPYGAEPTVAGDGTKVIGPCPDCACVVDQVLDIDLSLSTDYLPILACDLACPLQGAFGNEWASYVRTASGGPGDTTLADVVMGREYCSPCWWAFWDALAHHRGDAANECVSCFSAGSAAALEAAINARLADLGGYYAICLGTAGGPFAHSADLFQFNTGAPGSLVNTGHLLTWLNLGNRRLIVFNWGTTTSSPFYGTYPGLDDILAELGSGMSVSFGNDVQNFAGDFDPTHYLTADLAAAGDYYGCFSSNYVAGGTPLVTGGSGVLVAVERFSGTGGPYEIIVSGNKIAASPFVLAAGGEATFWKRTFPRTTGNGGLAIP